MDRSELFNQALFVASRLLERDAHDDALVVLQLLAQDEAFGAVRVIACVNCAIVHEQRNEVAHALAWYDRGIALEQNLHSCLASRYKAALLANTGRTREALEIYLALLAGPLQPEDQQAIRDAVAAIEAADR
jgi:tetratricopeptide (TPR) repeat protein